MQFNRQTVISATTSKKIVLLESLSVGNLAVGNTESHMFLSPNNTMSRLLALRVLWPAYQTPSSPGSRYMSFQIQSNITGNNIDTMYAGNNNVNKEFEFLYNNFLNARAQDNTNISPLPSNDASALSNILHAIQFDQNIGFMIQFTTTGIPSPDTTVRKIDLFVEQEVVAT